MNHNTVVKAIIIFKTILNNIIKKEWFDTYLRNISAPPQKHMWKNWSTRAFIILINKLYFMSELIVILNFSISF